MSTNLDSILGTLRDVGGIYGSFALTNNGDIVGRDMPAIFDSEALGQAGARVLRIYDTFASVESEIKSCQLRFKENKLHIRKLAGGYLFVLTPRNVHMPALRMAMNLVARRLSSINLAAIRRAPPAPPAPPSPPPGQSDIVETAPIPEPLPQSSSEPSAERQAIPRPRRRSTQQSTQQPAARAPLSRRSSQQPAVSPPGAPGTPNQRPATSTGPKRAMVYRGRKITRNQ